MVLVRSAATVGGYTMLSRILGFVRDILIAATLGAGPVADAFFVAFRLPNMFRRLVAEGAFAAAFVPMFSRHLETEGREAARTFAEQTLAVLFSTVLVFTILIEIAMPWFMYLFAPGFADDPARFDLVVEFTRLTFPYLLCMALVALLGGILNSLYRFAAAAAAPVLLNVILITGLLGFTDMAATPGHVLAWGVALAGVGQLVWLAAVTHRAGIRLKLRRPRLTPEVRRLLRLMVPGAATAGVMQINLLVGTIIATLQAEAVSYLYYADRVYQLPLGVVGIAVGTALLPNLSRNLRGGAQAAAMHNQARALELALLFTVPAAAALMVIPGPIITVLFERGAFSAEAASATAAALIAFASGLPAYVLVKVLSPGFFAREDLVTPLRISIIAVVTNVVLSIALFWRMGHVGIALATALSSWLHAALLWILLKNRGYLVVDERLRSRLPRTALASLVMAVALFALASVLEGPLAGSQFDRIAALAALVLAGLAVFALSAELTGAARFREIKAALSPRPATDEAEKQA
jgi:putative peptidoglycan lipid II flippase